VVAQAIEPETPASSEPPPGTRPDRTGKIAAVIATCIMLAGVVWLTITILLVRDQVAVKIESVVESVDATDGCSWRLAIELRNNSSETVTVSRIAAVLNRGMHSGTMQDVSPLEPEETGMYRVSFRLPARDDCPAADEVNHGNLIFHFADGSSESLRF